MEHIDEKYSTDFPYPTHPAVRTPSPALPAPRIRRRRLLLGFALIGALVLAFLAFPALRFSSVSRPKSSVPAPSPAVSELVGLLHFVATDPARPLPASTNPNSPIPLSTYAGGANIDWLQAARELHAKHPVIVFSKTYCGFSARAKALLASLALDPPPTIVEVDLREDGDAIKHVLTRLTHHSTFPNVFIDGVSIGGADDLRARHAAGLLRPALLAAGVKVGEAAPAI